MSSATFLGDDPGASKYGNFINYYHFHPAKERLEGFPTDIWWANNQGRRFTCLDVGCNSGELTQALWDFISHNLKFKPEDAESGQITDDHKQSADGDEKCTILGVDLDPTLISRAKEANSSKDLVHFKCCDIMNDTEVEEVVRSFFEAQNQGLCRDHKFDAVFLLSVSMWIHLNYGDLGLRKLLLTAAKLSRNLIVIEPQLWKCYSAAKRRCTRAGGNGFPLLPEITVRGDEAIGNEMSEILSESGFKKITEFEAPKWKRKMLFYQQGTVQI